MDYMPTIKFAAESVMSHKPMIEAMPLVHRMRRPLKCVALGSFKTMFEGTLWRCLDERNRREGWPTSESTRLTAFQAQPNLAPAFTGAKFPRCSRSVGSVLLNAFTYARAVPTIWRPPGRASGRAAFR